ncbi:MAG: Uma2 family endonuclease, partial [Fimbriiglobus sp.]
MSPAATTAPLRLLTADEFSRLPNPADGSKQELVRGEVVTIPPPGFRHGDVQGNVLFAVKSYVKQSKTGRVTVETGLVTGRDPDSVRGPDVAFWSFARLPADQYPAVYPTVAADLVAEVLSPGNTRRQIAQ